MLTTLIVHRLLFFFLPRCSRVGLKFYRCPYLQKWFMFSNLSLPQPNIMKLTQNVYYHKIKIKFEFWWHHLYCSRVYTPLQIEKLLNFCFYIKKEIWYDCQWDNCPQETKMTQTLTTIGHRTAFNNEQSPYLIVSYKRPR